MGIRQKFEDKKQIISFGGKKCSLSKEILLDLGQDCLKKLDGGMSEAEVKEWVLEMVRDG